MISASQLGKSGADNQSVQLLGQTCADNYRVGADDVLINWSVQLLEHTSVDSWSVQLPDDLGLAADNQNSLIPNLKSALFVSLKGRNWSCSILTIKERTAAALAWHGGH